MSVIWILDPAPDQRRAERGHTILRLNMRGKGPIWTPHVFPANIETISV